MHVPDRVVSWVLRARGANRAFRTIEGAEERLAERSVRPESFAPPTKLRTDVVVTAARREGWPVYTVTPRGATPRGCVVYAHGGAYVHEIVPQHWTLAAQIAVECNTTVVVPIYPLVPCGTAQGCVETFVELALELRRAHDDVRLAGDSAGGQIVLSTALELRDRHAVTLTLTVLISPAVDLTWSNHEIPAVQPKDPWLGIPGARVFSELWRGDLPVTDQRVSPLFGDLNGLGPLVVFSGTHDILNPDANRLVDAARAAGVEVEFHEGDGQLHVYPLLPTRAGEHARSRITAALNDIT